MARLHDDASSEYLYNGNAVRSDYPFVVSFWFKPTENVVDGLFWIGDHSTVNERLAFMYMNALKLSTQGKKGGNSDTATTTNTATLSAWNHALGIYGAVGNKYSVLNGDTANKGTSSGSTVGVPSSDSTALGVMYESTPNYYYTGDIAEVAVWDLSVWPGADVTAKMNNFMNGPGQSLSKGYSPKMFPLGLVAYWPLIRGLNDRVGGYNMTASGTVVSAHSIPGLKYPAGIIVPSFAAGGVIKYASGTIAGQSSLSATPKTTKKVSGTIAAVGALSGSVKTEKKISGTIAGQSALSATAWELYALVSGTIAAKAVLSARATVEKWSGVSKPAGAWNEKSKPASAWTETQKPQGNWQES